MMDLRLSSITTESSETNISLSPNSNPDPFSYTSSLYEVATPEREAPASPELYGDDEDPIEFLNKRFASFPDGDSTVFVGLGDLDSGVGKQVTKIYSDETLKTTVLKSFPKLDMNAVDAWMATPELRNHYPGGVSFNQSPFEIQDGRMYVTVNIDEDVLDDCDYGQLFQNMLRAKAQSVIQGFAGIPTILLANPRFAEETTSTTSWHLSDLSACVALRSRAT